MNDLVEGCGGLDGTPSIPPDLQSIVSEQTVPVGETNYRLLAIDDLVRYAARQPRGTEAPYWAIVWEASIALAGWIQDHPEQIKKTRMLELGCGLGLSGLAAAKTGADVVQTDKIPLALQLARENFTRNGLPPPTQFCADWLDWNHSERYDFVFGSDLVYEPSLIPSLLPIFRENCRPDGQILLAAPLHREPALVLIDRLYSEGWRFETETRTIAWEERHTDVGIWLGRR